MKNIWLIIAVVSVCVGMGQAQPLLQYTFNDGTAKDVSGNGNDGTLLDAAVVVDDAERGMVLQINQTGVQADGPFALTTSFTLSAWIKLDEGQGGRNYFAASGKWLIRADNMTSSKRDALEINIPYNPRKFWGKMDTTSGQANAGILDSQWHHIVIVLKDGTEVTGYYDGEVVAELTKSDTDLGGEVGPLNFGGNISGYMDDIRIYDYAVPAEEIEGLMNEGSQDLAQKPTPADTDSDIVLGTPLSWKPSDIAVSHDIYVGSTFEDVNDASRDHDLGTLLAQEYADTSIVPQDQTYSDKVFWRVDTVDADGIIYKGSVWQYEIESYAYLLTSVTATASGQISELGPEKTIDGSGLDDKGQHSAISSEMWLAVLDASNPTWIQYQFDDVYSLQDIMIWNGNAFGEASVGMGVKDVTIEVTLDGNNWTPVGDFVIPQAPGAPGYKPESAIDLAGIMAQSVRLVIHNNWGGGLPNLSLSEVQFRYVPLKAWDSEPADGAIDFVPGSVLSWRTGRKTTENQVYLGTDPENIVLQDTVAASEWDTTGIVMDLGQLTYWRIDGTDGSDTWPGKVWQFTTRLYSSIDDFERYTTDADVFEVWLDGYGQFNDSGSTVDFVRTDQKYDGKQSMAVLFNNTGMYDLFQPEKPYSETYCEVSEKDWTLGGANALFLAWRADTDTEAATDTLYLGVEDTAGKQAFFTWDGSIAGAEGAQWHEWTINFSELGEVNVASIAKIYIGVGDRNNPVLGGTGTLWIDAIRTSVVE